MESPGANLHVIRLQQRTAVLIPEIVEPEDELLEGEHERACVGPFEAFEAPKKVRRILPFPQ